jgi:hypothetical protein
MNRSELKVKLDTLGINSDFYDLYGHEDSDKSILAKKGKRWVVYDINERGGRHSFKYFDIETEACEYFYSKMYNCQDIMYRANHNIPQNPKTKITFEVTSEGKILIFEDGVLLKENLDE